MSIEKANKSSAIRTAYRVVSYTGTSVLVVAALVGYHLHKDHLMPRLSLPDPELVVAIKPNSKISSDCNEAIEKLRNDETKMDIAKALITQIGQNDSLQSRKYMEYEIAIKSSNELLRIDEKSANLVCKSPDVYIEIVDK